MHAKTVLLLTAFVASAVAGPLSSRGSCARHCTESSKLKYEPGTTYTYDYSADTTTTMMGTMDEESKLHIKASVLLTVHSKCDMSMQLRDVSLEEYDPKFSTSYKASINSEQFSKDLERNSLRFSFQDGMIEDICPSTAESSWVLNAKRGILTIFQNSMSDLSRDEALVEVDVSGKCPVTYESHGTSWGTTTVKKSKDYVKCLERQSADTSIQSTSYNHKSGIKSNPLIKGNQDCTQTFSSQKLQKSTCEENLIFRPFSNKKSGAVTKASQTLTYNSAKKSSFAGDDYEAIRSKLIFNHENEKNNDERKYQDAREALVSLCENSVDDIREKVPHLFNQYVYTLKQLKYPELKALYARSNEICKFNQKAGKYFTDALPSVGTEGSVNMMTELIEKKKVSDMEADYWYTSFAFMSNPDLSMLNHVASSLNEPRKQAVLGISSMVNTYCLSDPECEHKPAVRRIITKLSAMLNGNCQASNEAESLKILLALKGIGNAGHSGQVVDTLSNCAKNTKTSNEIRIAAIDAFRRQSCTVSRRSLMNQFRDLQEDTEVRIAAYLAIMKCPSSSIVQSVKEVLNIEEVNQVGSFVWTHLTNMQQTTDPCKEDIKDLLRNTFLEKKFSTDARKFSRAFEKSLYSEKLNSGVHFDSNVIFTPQSYLPRSAMFNFTMDLFGHSLNLFEVGGQVEGFEHLVESFFGPNGLFKSGFDLKGILEKSRGKRSVYDSKIEEFQKLYKKQDNNFDNPEGSMYFKMFGNELMYENFEGLESLFSYTKNQIDWVKILADLAKNRDVEFTKSMMFLDTTYTVPTSAGFPLHLSVNGSYTVNLKLGGKLDLRNILNKEIDINGHIKPSGAVEISAVMSVDAFYARTGLKMTATMHSSTNLDGKIQMKDGKILKTTLNVPNDKIEILDVQTNMFLIHQNVEYEQKGIEIERTEVHKCTGKTISKIIGMEMCGEVQFPNASLKYDSPYFPLTGPTKFSIYVKKTDLKMKSYKFDATYENTNDKKAALLSFDTPGSDVDREMTVEMSMDKKDHKVALRLRTPMKKMGVSGELSNKENQKKAEFIFTIDDIEKLAMVADLNIQKRSDSIRYTPRIEIRTPGMKTIKLSGYGFFQPERRLIVDINVENLTKKTLEFKVDVNKQGKDRYAVDSRLSSYILSSKIRGNVQTRERGTTTNMNIDYSVLEGKYQKMKIGTKFQDLSASSLKKLRIGVTLDMSAAPQYNTQLNWETQMAKGHIENTLKVSQGIKGKNKIDVFMQEIVSYSFRPGKNSIYTNFKFKIPVKKINYVWYMKHQNTASFVKSRAFVQYASRQRVDLQAQAYSVNDKMNSEIKLTYPGREMKLEGKLNFEKKNQYEATGSAQWQKGKKATAAAVYINKSSRKEHHHTLEIDASYLDKSAKYNGEAKVNDKIYMTKHRVEYGKDVYMFNADYVLAQTKFTSVLFLKGKSYISEAYLVSKDTLNKAVFDVKLDTYRHIKGLVSFNSQDSRQNNKVVGKVNILWDADKDVNERFELNFNYNPADLSSYASLYYPDRTLTATIKPQFAMGGGAFDARLQSDFSWESNKKISVGINFFFADSGRQIKTTVVARTPFAGYREMSLKHNHQFSLEKLMSKTNAMLDRNDNFNLEFNGIYQDGHVTIVKGDMKCTSTIDDYESFGFEFEQTISSSQFKNNATISWGKYKEISFSMNGMDSSDYYTTSIQGQFYFTSPFENYKSLSGSINHRLASTQITSTGHFKWSPSKEISVNFGGSGMKQRNKQICKATVRISTPFSNYENIASTIQYENDGKQSSSNGELSWSYKKITFGYDKSQTKSSSGDKLEGSVYLNSPFSGFESLKASRNHESGRTNFKNMFEVQISEEKYTLKTSGKMQSVNNFEAAMEIYTPMENFKTFQSKFSHDMSGKETTCHLEVVLNEDKTTVDLKTELRSGRKSAFNWDLAFTSPLTENKELTISGKHQNQPGRISNILKCKLGWKKVVLDHSLQYSSMLNYINKIEFSHPWKNEYPQLVIENRNNIAENFLRSRNSLTADSKLWKLNGDYKATKNKVQADFSVEDVDGKLFSLTGINEVDKNSYNPSVNVEWRQNSETEQMRLSATWNLYKEITQRDGEIRFTSSLEGYETLVAKVEYDLRDHNKNARVIFSMNDNSLSLVGKVDTYKKTGALTFTSPFENFEELILEGSYVYDRNMNGALSLQWAPSKKMELSAALVKTDEKAATTIEFSSPFESYEKLIFTGNYDVSRKKKTAEMSLQLSPYKAISLKSHVKIQKEKGNSKLTFTSPFEGYTSVVLHGSYDMSKNTKKASISYECPNNHKMSFEGEIKSTKNVKEAKITVNTPFEQINSLVLSTSLDTSNELMTGSIKGIWNNEKTIELSGNFQKDAQRLMKGEITFTSPFENFENMKYNMRMEKYAKTYQGSTSFSWSADKKMTTDVTIKMDPFDVTIRADSPFDPVKNVIMRTTFTKNEDLEFDFASTLEWKNINKIVLNFQNQVVRGNELQTSFSLATPFEKFDLLELKSTFLVSSDVLATGFSAKTPFKSLPSLEISSTYQNRNYKNIRAEFQIDTDETIFKATANKKGKETKLYLSAPQILKKPLTADITESSNWITINFSTGYNLYTAKYSLVLDSENKKLLTEVRIPTLSYKNRVMNFDLSFTNRQNKAIDVSAKFRNVETTHEVSATFNQGYKLLQGKLVLTTPLLETKTVTLMGDVQYDYEKKINVYFKTPSTTYSIVGLLGDHTTDKVNGFISLNTPADVFGTVRLDINFLKNDWTNTEGSIKLETSNRNFRTASINGKFVDYSDRMEFSSTVQTPFENYEKITLSGRLNHDEEWKSIKPTVVLSIPGYEMNVFGEYEDTYDHNKIIVGFTNDKRQTYEASAQVEKREYSIVLGCKIPSDYTVKSYQTQMKYKNQNGQRTFDASLTLPDNERAAINSAINYNDWKNFNGRVSFTSTFDNYESLSATVHQSISSRKTDFQLRTSWSPSKIVKVEVKTTDDGTNSNKRLEIITPWELVQDISAAYDYSQKSYQKTHDVEVKYYRNVVAHLSATFDLQREQVTTIALELPTLYLKSSGMMKSGQQPELTFKVDIPSRVVFFHTLYAPSSRGFKHSTEFAWNQRKSRQASYEVIYADRSTRSTSTGDLTIRLIHPIRSFEVKFNHACTSRAASLSTKFMWDPLRDTRKQMTVVIDVNDKSVYGKYSYNGAVTLKTPRLYKDVKLLGLLEFSNKNREMFKTNLKLDYNGNRRQALEFELKLNDDTKSRGRDGIQYSLRSRLLQPDSVTYFNTFSALVITPNVKKFDTRFSYVDSSSTKRAYMVRSNLNKKKLTAQFSSPSKSIKMVGNVQSDSADFDVTVNKKKVLFAQSSFKAKDMSADVDIIYYPTNDGLRLKAFGGESVSVEVSHKNQGKDFSDFLFTLGLRTPRIVSSRMNWRTTIMSELENEIISVYTTQKEALGVQLENLMKKIKTEAAHKFAGIQRVNAAELKPLMGDWKIMKNDLYYDYVVLKNQAKNMYKNNEFYMQDIAMFAESVWDVVSEKCVLAIRKIGEKMECLKNCVYDMAVSVGYFVAEMSSDIISFFKMCIEEVVTFFYDSFVFVCDAIEFLRMKAVYIVEVCLYYIQQCLIEQGYELMNKAIYFVNEYMPFVQTIEEYLEKLNDYKNSMMTKVSKSSLYKVAKKYYDIVMEFVEEVKDIEFAEAMKGHYNKVSSNFQNTYTKVQGSMDDLFTAVSEHPHIAFASEIANHGYQKVAWAYRYWGVDEALDTLYQNWYKIVATVVKDIAHDATSKYTSFIRDSKLVFKPDMGKIEVDLRIPSDRNNLMHIFDIYSSPEYKQLVALKEKYLPENRMTFWDYWYTYKPSSDVSNWVPPFKAQAMIAGSQHYMTFDKLFYDFAGQCSYLLAHDMIDGEFTVIAKYEKDYNNVPKKSIVVKSSDQTIEITPAFKVLVDDETINLPYQFQDTMITRFDDVITLSSKKGLTVRCNFFRNVCTVDMSGWYFAKTGGLFGVYDNEPQLDMQKPDGDLAKSIGDFSQSWSVGSGRCTKENYAAKKDSYDMEAKRICEETFTSEYSSLRPGFKVVPTEKFIEMCQVDTTNRDKYKEPLDEAICASAYAYKQRCLSEDIEVKMPSTCGRCKGLNNKPMNDGDTFTIDSNNKPSAADIVFIVEEKKCNKDKFPKLEEMAQGIERSLREKGIRKATYSVVGYGGSGVHEKPHVHWSESEQSGNYRSVANAFRSLTVGNGKSDVYEAILFATNLKFTPGAAKTFVLVKCGSCNEGKMQENYSDMLWMLMNHDISLHVLMETDFKLRSGSRKSSGIFGIDKYEAYTSKDIRDKKLKGDTTIRDQIYDVKDLCIPLALETNGTMFNSHKLVDKKRNIQKNFIHVFSRKLVQTTEAPNCQLCFCHSHEESSGKVECSACISPFVQGILTPNLPDISSWPEKSKN